jgi:hypothetical protein
MSNVGIAMMKLADAWGWLRITQRHRPESIARASGPGH